MRQGRREQQGQDSIQHHDMSEQRTVQLNFIHGENLTTKKESSPWDTDLQSSSARITRPGTK